MMCGAHERLGDEREQTLHLARRHSYLFQQILVAAKEREAAPARRFRLRQILRDALRRRQRLRQRPFKRVVPEFSRNSAECLFDFSGASQNVCAAGIDRKVIGDLARLPVEFFVWNSLEEFARTRVQAQELFV